MIIKNLDSIIEQLTEMLMDFDRELNGYDTDVYLYYDEETETARLDTFVNVGGNSWLDDDHYAIYTDKQHYDTFLDFWNSIAEFAESLGMTERELVENVAKYYHIDTEDVGYVDVHDWICDHEKAFDTLAEIYSDYIENDLNAEYHEKAEEIMDRFFTDITEYEHVQKYGY